MNIINITHLVCSISHFGAPSVLPFIIVSNRSATRGESPRKPRKLEVYWLEHANGELPTEADISAKRIPSKHQALDSYWSLPVIDAGLAVFDAVAERIPDGDIGVARPDGIIGCLWTMLPKERPAA